MPEVTKTTLHGPNGLRIELDSSEIFPKDPGNGTPAMVYQKLANKTFSATYWCAQGESELDGKQLTEIQMEWINSKEKEVDTFLREHTPAD